MSLWTSDASQADAVNELFAQQWGNPMITALKETSHEIVSILAPHCPYYLLQDLYLKGFARHNQHYQLIIKDELASKELSSQTKDPEMEGWCINQKLIRGDLPNFANIHPENWYDGSAFLTIRTAIETQQGDAVDALAAVYKNRIPQTLFSNQWIAPAHTPLLFAMERNLPAMVTILAKHYTVDQLRYMHNLYCVRENGDFTASEEVQAALSLSLSIRQQQQNQRLAFLMGLLPPSH